MTDLNTLVPADSPWFFLEALGINDRGQIAGYAFNASTGEVHGLVATPVQDNENVALPSPVWGRPKVVLPESVRQLLRQRRRIIFPGLGALGAPRDKFRCR